MAAERDRVRMLVGVGTRPDKMKGLNHKGIWSRANSKPNFKWAYLSNHLELSELFDGPGRSEHASLLDITYMLTSRIFRIFQAAKNIDSENVGFVGCGLSCLPDTKTFVMDPRAC